MFFNDIARIKSNPKNFIRRAFGNEKDLLLFYVKDPQKNIFNDIRRPFSEEELKNKFVYVDENGFYNTVPLHAPGETNGITGQSWRGMKPPKGRHWRCNPEKFDELDKLGLIKWSKTGNPRMKKYSFEHKGKKIQDIWNYKDPQYPVYPTEKNIKMLDMIVKMSSLKESIIMDCFAGSGSMLLAAEMNNRTFIGMDKSLLSLNTIKNRNLQNVKYVDLEKLSSKV